MGVHETSIHVSRRACPPPPPPPPPPPYYSLYINILLLLTCIPDGSQVAIPLRTSSNGRKFTLVFLMLFIFDFSNSMRFTTNNRHRSVLVRVPVHGGPLSTVKHICFVSICWPNLTGLHGGPDGFNLLLWCAGLGDRAWRLAHLVEFGTCFHKFLHLDPVHIESGIVF